jgi:methyl-accepting chemotaxis protein
LSAVAAGESGYLAFGNELHRIHERAMEVSKTSASLLALMGGDGLNTLTIGLKEFLDKDRDFGTENRQGSLALEAILDKANRIAICLQTFRSVVRTLQILCNFIKIESIRLGEGKNGFHALAEDVRILIRNIEAKSSPAMDQSDSLILLVKENFARVLSFEQNRQDKGKIITNSIMDDLDALSERHQDSSQRMVKITALWEEIANGIGEIVSSLQFHDITRQRIEHVAEALKKSSDGDEKDEAYEAYMLQKAQLLHTKKELASATERIGEELRNLSRKIGEMSLEARGVMENARGAGASFFSELEKAVVELTEAVNEHSAINREMASTTEQVSNAASQMDGFIKEIVKIGIEMKMISLNAAVQAAHVGGKGLAMGVLAEQIHTLSQETSGRVTSISEDLHCILDHASNLKDCTALVSQRRAEEGLQMVEDLKRMLPLLRKLDAEAVTLLDRIEAEGETLSTEIRDRSEGLHFHEQILQGIDSLSSEIEKECAKIGEGPAKKDRRSSRSGGIGGMKELAKTYTMQREREVHLSMLGAGNSESAPGVDPEKAGEKKQGEELGENVELF